jgi:DNA-nicking Smr family endonuclease
MVRGRASVAGLDRRNAQRLRRGQMTIEARLDLHGMTQGSAHPALRRFLVHGTEAGHRCVLVITGKGTPREAEPDAGFMPDRSLGILRSEVPRWLAEPDAQVHVVAWAPAIPRDGGDGALYVLLRRKR